MLPDYHMLMLRRTAARDACYARYCLVESSLLLIRHGDSRLDAAHRTHRAQI